MSHARKQIRAAMRTVLAGTPTAGEHAFDTRIDALSPDELPALLVDTGAERVVADDFGRYQTRSLEVQIRVVAQSTADIAGVVDDIAAEVETAIEAAGTLGGLIKGAAQLTGTDPYFAGAGSPVGEAVLRYAALYVTQAGQPGTTL